MKTLKGPGIFLAQFMGDKAPFNDIMSISKWAKEIGFKMHRSAESGRK